MKVENKKKKIIISLTVVFLLLLIVGASYAYILLQKGQTTSNVINSTCLRLDIEDVNNSAINLSSAYPMSAEEAKSLTPYKFKIVNKCDVNTSFTIKLDVLNTENKLKNEYVAVSLDNEYKGLLTNLTESTNTITYDGYTVDKSYILGTGEVEKKGEKIYDLRLWMDASAGNDAMNKTFLSKISIDATQSANQLYVDKELNGADPVIKDGLVPVTIADNGDVTKADLNSKWYDYGSSIWANAVILSGTDNYQVGQTIPEEAIESYFVWIPKYKYKLFNVEGNEIPSQEIEIEFGTSNTTDTDSSCVATNASGDIGNCKNLNDEKGNGKWMTHPAFQSIDDSSDNSKIKGIWVGKFETTGSTSVPTVKPNVASLTNITGKVMYDTAWNFNRNLDSHMMKNTEWGAMAYLTNSKYGRGNTEVWINNYWNNNQTLTGCTGASVSAGSSTTCTTPYFNNVAVKEGSTTRNMSGIFDTSGGVWDMVMGNLNNTPSSSGFPTNLGIASKYYDKYTGENPSARILGDATQETYGWNGDYTYFVGSSDPWFCRGGNCNNTTGAGVFTFTRYSGGAGAGYGFRLVLSPTN